jgi:hypothetical protein
VKQKMLVLIKMKFNHLATLGKCVSLKKAFKVFANIKKEGGDEL